MRLPLHHAHGNLVFSDCGVWAWYELWSESYPGMSSKAKFQYRDKFDELAHVLDANFQILRLQTDWPIDRYEEVAEPTVDSRHCDGKLWAEMIANDKQKMTDLRMTRSRIYLTVQLAGLDRSLSGYFDRLVRRLESSLELGSTSRISESALREYAQQEERSRSTLSEFLNFDPADTFDLQNVCLHQVFRGLGEPLIDNNWSPNALEFLEGDELQWMPLEHDMLRLSPVVVTRHNRYLELESEAGTSFQAHLSLGSFPVQGRFPGPETELMFAPLEQVPFPVDASLCVKRVSNESALSKIRKKVIDSDHLLREEDDSDLGASSETLDRTRLARDLRDQLSDQTKPPLLETSLSLAVGAKSKEEMDKRVDSLRRAYGHIKLELPVGAQENLFSHHYPGQVTKIKDYTEAITTRQFGCLAVTAASDVGSGEGAYLGYTVPARQPVFWSPKTASRMARPTAVLLVGTLGSGKTIAAQRMGEIAYKAGSIVVDIDPKQDHRLHELPGIRENSRVLEISTDSKFRGVFDPIRLVDNDLRLDLATDFLLNILPPRLSDRADIPIRRALRVLIDKECKGLGPIVEILRSLNHEVATECAESIIQYRDRGLAQLGFSDERDIAGDDLSQLTTFRVRNLDLPSIDTARSDYTTQERTSVAIQRLQAAHIMRLISGDRSRNKVVIWDEAKFILETQIGRRIIDQLIRWGRSENATIILATQRLEDLDKIHELVGQRFIFGIETESEARYALELLGLDSDDGELQERLQLQRQGLCFYGDLHDRVGRLQIDVTADLLECLNTTPDVQVAA